MPGLRPETVRDALTVLDALVPDRPLNDLRLAIGELARATRRDDDAAAVTALAALRRFTRPRWYRDLRVSGWPPDLADEIRMLRARLVLNARHVRRLSLANALRRP